MRQELAELYSKQKQFSYQAFDSQINLRELVRNCQIWVI